MESNRNDNAVNCCISLITQTKNHPMAEYLAYWKK